MLRWVYLHYKGVCVLYNNNKNIQFVADYELIPTGKGKYLLMINNYTYCQIGQYGHYYCSKHGSGCKAKLKLDSNGVVLKADYTHSHEPPRFMKTFGGDYVRFR